MRHDPPRPAARCSPRRTSNPSDRSAGRPRRRSGPAALLLGGLSVAGLLSGCTSLTGDAARPWKQDANLELHTTLSVGGRDTSADPVTVQDSSQLVVGLEVDWHDPRAFLGYEVGVLLATEDDVDYQEGYAGLRRTWLRDGITPFVGAGVSFMNTEPDGFPDFDSWGGYAHGGFYIPLSPTFFSFGAPTHIGVDLRALAGDHISATELRLFIGFGKP